MSPSQQFLNPSEAARQLGVSPKALRLYEQRGLLTPLRTSAGWRAYGPVQMGRARQVTALRQLGLSLAQVSEVLQGHKGSLEAALAARQAVLQDQARALTETAERLRAVRSEIAQGGAPSIADLARLSPPEHAIVVAFKLPWPWGGEEFVLRGLPALTYIIGPLGSGKTRLAKAIAAHLPDAAFIDLDRLGGTFAEARMDADAPLKARVEDELGRLVADGASASASLLALLVALESAKASVLVIDMIEQGLDTASQWALLPYLRRSGAKGRRLVMLTRSTAILDLGTATADDAILLCPANHSPPLRVLPYPGAPGYESVATCLASPEVRSRTEGTIAWRPNAA